MIEPSLKHRLHDWATAYAGEAPARTVYTGTETLAPTPLSEPHADAAEIERIVVALEQAGRWKECRVLRAEYFLAGLTESERLCRLRRLGVSVSRASYYVHLDAARAFVSGALSQSSSREAA